MSAVGDALAALRNVVLMQERLDVMQRRVDSMSLDMRGLGEALATVDRRVARLEGFIDGAAAATTPRLKKD